MSASVCVQEGDTLAIIAARYNGIDEGALQELNPTDCGLLDMDADLCGWETINLPLGSDGFIWYLVQHDCETLQDIAALHCMDVDTLGGYLQEHCQPSNYDPCGALLPEVTMVPIRCPGCCG
jgi:hypothetical protein